MPMVRWSVGDRPLGRGGVGASNHCAHGRGVSTEVVVNLTMPQVNDAVERLQAFLTLLRQKAVPGFPHP